MALFVDLDDEAEPPQPHDYNHHLQHLAHKGLQPTWSVTEAPPTPPSETPSQGEQETADHDSHEGDNGNAKMTEALRCYPIVMAIASSLDLNALDSLSRVCRDSRQALLSYHDTLMKHTMHCVNEDVPVDPEETFRFRARAGNHWHYFEDSRGDYNGKSGSCARDMVAECRRCSRVVCRNCTIKPPASKALRDRHRRLCPPCTKAPLGTLTSPPLLASTTVSSPIMQRAICSCESEGVWLCQPCGRTIRGADSDYHSIWKWRNQYGEVLSGLGTGIGEGDRGVICGREGACCGYKEREQETDCDAEDARQHDLHGVLGHHGGGSGTPQTPLSTPGGAGPATPLGGLFGPSDNYHNNNSSSTSVGGINIVQQQHHSNGSAADLHYFSDSEAGGSGGSHSGHSPPLRKPGYARHEVEGIGGRVKTMLVRTVRVGACVAEWEDERCGREQMLSREFTGRSRSWCGWCWRVIPGNKDHQT